MEQQQKTTEYILPKNAFNGEIWSPIKDEMEFIVILWVSDEKILTRQPLLSYAPATK